jgi:lipopolysaccharide transport system permease protein
LLGVVLLALASLGAGFLVATFCTRYRDMQQVVVSLLQVLMFLTPIFWRADQLPQRSVFVDWNPAYYFVEVVRAPLLGTQAHEGVYATAAWITAALCLAGLLLFARYRLRIVYWL